MSAPNLQYPPASGGGTPVGGSGTPGTIPVWSGSGTTLTNSGLLDDGTQIYTTTRNVGIGAAPWSQFTVGSGGTNSPAATVALHNLNANEYRLKLTSANFNANGNWLGLGLGFSNNYLKAAIIAEAKDANARADLHFALNAAASSANASIADSRMVITYGGNVGIGTASPFTRTDSLSSRSTAFGSIASFNTMPLSVTDDTAFAIGVGGGINFRAKLTSSTYATYAAIWSARETATNSDYRGSLVFATADNANGYPSERARIDSSGNVGIGTASPYARASVRGAAGVGLGAWSTSGASPGTPIAASLFLGDDNFYNASFYNQCPGLSATYDAARGNSAALALYYYNGSNRAEGARLDGSGNVGIGTASPAAKFHVKDATNRNIIMTSGTTGMKITSITDASAEADIGVQGNTVQFLTGGTERARITSAGNVHAASGTTTMTDGFFYIPAAAGAPTGVPTAIAGRVPMYYDTTNNNFYVYNGAWKKVLLA